MLRFLAHTALTIIGNAIGLLLTSLVLPGFHINVAGFIFSILFFSGVEILFEPFVISMALKYMPALRGGIALVTTFVGLFLTVIFTSGLRIEGVTTWLLAPLVIWVSVVIAGVVLPLFLFKNILQEVAERKG